MEKSPRPPITDSPWFWVYLFGTAALIALVLIGKHYGERQARLERQFQARERSGLVEARDAADQSLSEPDDTIIPLWPLYLIAGAVAVGGWVMLWWKHFYRGRRTQTPAAAGQGNQT